MLSIVPVEVFRRCSTAGAACSFGNIAVDAPADREEFPPVVRTLPFPAEMLPVFMSDRNNLWKDVRFELLVFGRMGIVELELPERNISADEREKPGILAIKILYERNEILYNVHEQYTFFSNVGFGRLTLYTKAGGIALFLRKSPKTKVQ